MTELLPCPFCSSGWLYETWHNGYCNDTPVMFCNSCKAVVTWEQVEEEGVNDETQAFVREHWNTRAERTCKADYRSGGYGIGGWYCSECGGYMHDDMQQDMAYCPNCGARVVGE